MANLIFDQNYLNFLQDTHPHLKINKAPSGVPFFCTRVNIWEILPQTLYGHITRSLAHKFSHIFWPRVLILGLPFEPYCQNFILEKNFDFSYFATQAKKQECNLISILNIQNTNYNLKNLIKNNKYLLTPSFPNMIIKTSASSFENYLLEIHAKNRQDIRRNMREFFRNGNKICDARSINKNYLEKINLAYANSFRQAKIKWIPYSHDYFAKFLNYSPKAHLLYALDKYDNFLGFINFIRTQTELHVARLAVAPNYISKQAIYFMLLYSSIKYAIEQKLNIIHLGPTAYRLKKRLGAKMQPLVNLVCPLSPTYRLLLLAQKYICSSMLDHLSSVPSLEGNF